MKSLAAGADRLLALRTARAPEALADGLRTAEQLAALVHRAGTFDLVLTGRMAADTNAGTVGPALAALLDLPLVTMATRLERANGAELLIERLESEAIELVSCPLPALVTVSSEIGDLPSIGLTRLREAKNKPFELLGAAEMGLEALAPDIELVTLEKPSLERDCRMLSDEDGKRSGIRLVQTLQQEGLL
jgi:electron transfer flavoprotein beta subunit